MKAVERGTRMGVGSQVRRRSGRPLLALRVCVMGVGGGHFEVGAARRIARAPGGQSAARYHMPAQARCLCVTW
jgi:hypothetical protein